MDELMNAVAPRLAELTKAEWGIVTAGCAAALTHATSACIAGADPQKIQRLPKLEGLKNQGIIPLHSRNVNDHAVRITDSADRSRSARKRSWACSRPWRCGSSATTKRNGRSGKRG